MDVTRLLPEAAYPESRATGPHARPGVRSSS